MNEFDEWYGLYNDSIYMPDKFERRDMQAAYLAGAAAMREKAAEVTDKTAECMFNAGSQMIIKGLAEAIRKAGGVMAAPNKPNPLSCHKCGKEIPHHPRYEFKTIGFCIRWLAVCAECNK